MADDSTQSALECVVDADSFIAFLDALRSDWDRAKTIETAAPTAPYTAMRGWENTTIGSFLEAAVAGGTDNPPRLQRLIAPDCT